MSVEDAEIEAMDSYDTLIKYKVVKIDEDSIVIDFLDEQLEALEGKRKQASEAGKRSAAVRRRKKESNDRSTTVNNPLNENEQSREEESRVEKSRVENTKEVRELTFREQVAQHTTYEALMLDEFADYWTESNPKGKKLKFELQKTFDIARRLKKWSSNNFNTSKDSTMELPTSYPKNSWE